MSVLGCGSACWSARQYRESLRCPARSAAHGGGQTGANAFLVRDKLGHKTLAMIGRYVNRDAAPLRDLSDKVESRIMGALNAGAATAKGETGGAEVVALPAGKGKRR